MEERDGKETDASGPALDEVKMLVCGVFFAMHAICSRGARGAYAAAMKPVFDTLLDGGAGASLCVPAGGRHVAFHPGRPGGIIKDGKLDLEKASVVSAVAAIDALVKRAGAVLR